MVKRPARHKIKSSKPAPTTRTTIVQDDDEEGGVPLQAQKTEPNDPFATLERNSDRHRNHTIPYRASDETTPKYTNDYLATLKAEQASAPPPDVQILTEDEALALYPPSPPPDSTTAIIQPSKQTHIPTATEIAEKKSRRARLAAQSRASEYISLSNSSHSSSSEGEEEETDLIVRAKEPRTKQPESRHGVTGLEDDDFGEDLEGFVDDPNARLATTWEAGGERGRRRQEIARVLEHDEEEDEEETDGQTAFDRAQTRAGTYATRATDSTGRSVDREREVAWRAQVERRYVVKLIPSLREAMKRLRIRIRQGEIEAGKRGKEQAIEGLRRERVEIAEEEGRIQTLLKEAGERLARLMGVLDAVDQGRKEGAEKGNEDGEGSAESEDDEEGREKGMDVEMETSSAKSDPGEAAQEEEEEEEETGRQGLGSGFGVRAGLGSGLSGRAGF